MFQSRGNLVFGLLLLAVGTLWLLNNTGVLYFDFGDFLSRAWPVAIILVGLWFLIGGRPGKVAFSDRAPREFSHAVGDVDYAPGQIDPEGLSVRVSAGEVRLDLRGTEFAEREHQVAVKIGFGDIEIKTPPDVPLKVEGRSGCGDLFLLNSHRDGFGAQLEFEDPKFSTATRRLRITAKSGLGDVRVTRS